MENWKISKRRNYKLHARVKGAGCGLVLRTGIPVPLPTRNLSGRITFVSAPHFYRRDNIEIARAFLSRLKRNCDHWPSTLWLPEGDLVTYTLDALKQPLG